MAASLSCSAARRTGWRADKLWSAVDLAAMIDATFPGPGKRGLYRKRAGYVTGRFGCLWIFLGAIAAYAAFVMLWPVLFPITEESYRNCVAGVIEARRNNIALCVQQNMKSD